MAVLVTMTNTIRATNYVRRVVDVELDELIDGGIAAISIEGAKAVGKSATAAERVAEAYLLEDPVVRQLIESDPSRLVGTDAVLIDEWQRLPATWDVVRRAVDAGARPGQFLLTGSASAQHAGTHSGAGRILKVRMRPMTLIERRVEIPSVSLSGLLSGSKPTIRGGTTVVLTDYVSEIIRSGFPAIRTLGDRMRRSQLAGYLERVIDHDFSDVTGRRLRNPTPCDDGSRPTQQRPPRRPRSRRSGTQPPPAKATRLPNRQRAHIETRSKRSTCSIRFPRGCRRTITSPNSLPRRSTTSPTRRWQPRSWDSVPMPFSRATTVGCQSPGTEPSSEHCSNLSSPSMCECSPKAQKPASATCGRIGANTRST
jgi:hypothetical protein